MLILSKANEIFDLPGTIKLFFLLRVIVVKYWKIFLFYHIIVWSSESLVNPHEAKQCVKNWKSAFENICFKAKNDFFKILISIIVKLKLRIMTKKLADNSCFVVIKSKSFRSPSSFIRIRDEICHWNLVF